MRANQSKKEREIELAHDKAEIDILHAKHVEDKEAYKKACDDQKAHYKEIWGAQRKLKEELDATEKYF